MLADRIKGGTLILGGKDNGDGVAKVLDGDGNEIVRMDSDGIVAKGKYVCEGTDGWDRKVEIYNGTVKFFSSQEETPVFIEYAPNGIDVRVGGTATDATGSSTVIGIRGKAITFLADSISTGGYVGQTGKAEFSDGTYLEFKNGFLIGGNTKEGNF